MLKKTLLISTVGAHENIPKSFKFVIESFNPKKAIYLTTSNPKVKNNFQAIKEIVSREYPGEIEIEEIFLEEVENMRKIIDELDKKLGQKIIDLEGEWKVIVDFTYGTKPISASLALWAIESQRFDKMIYISGTRDNTQGRIVMHPEDIIEIESRAIYLALYRKKAQELLRQFKFGEVKELLFDYLKSEIRSFLDYFENFCKGGLNESVGSSVKNAMMTMKITSDDFLKRNKDQIYNHIELISGEKKDLQVNVENVLEGLATQVFYFYDLTLIYNLREQKNEVLPLFVNFLDNLFSWLIVKKTKKLKKKDFFVALDGGITLRCFVKSEEKPLPISGKIDLLKKYQINFFSHFEEKIINSLIHKRNNSIFGHGYYIPQEEDIQEVMKLRSEIIMRYFGYKKDLYFWYPNNLSLEAFFG
ncbi:MAG: hypothetical protein NZL96_00400 [Patescibacteria group bacterium]|nr:hypothetical protein [Patescibacteria group bacterium]